MYYEIQKVTKSIEDIALDYEDEKNAMIAIAEKGEVLVTSIIKKVLVNNIQLYTYTIDIPKTQFSTVSFTFTDDTDLYEDFYEELDNRIRIEQSMDMIFFGPPRSFLRIDSESILHILVHIKKHLIPISRVLLAWDIITGCI